MLSEGDLIVAELPQADGGTKPRPVLLLKELPGFGDFLVCGVSSQIHQAQDGFDQIVASTDDFFDATGLQVTSVIRLNFLATLPPPTNDQTSRANSVPRSWRLAIHVGRPSQTNKVAEQDSALKAG